MNHVLKKVVLVALVCSGTGVNALDHRPKPGVPEQVPLQRPQPAPGFFSVMAAVAGQKKVQEAAALADPTSLAKALTDALKADDTAALEVVNLVGNGQDLQANAADNALKGDLSKLASVVLKTREFLLGNEKSDGALSVLNQTNAELRSNVSALQTSVSAMEPMVQGLHAAVLGEDGQFARLAGRVTTLEQTPQVPAVDNSALLARLDKAEAQLQALGLFVGAAALIGLGVYTYNWYYSNPAKGGLSAVVDESESNDEVRVREEKAAKERIKKLQEQVGSAPAA